MPFEPDSDPCNIDEMCRIGEQTCHTIPKEICDQHYFIGPSAPGTTGVVKCTLNGDKTSCVNGTMCDPSDQNWVNLQPRYSFNTAGSQGSTSTENINNICTSPALPVTDDCVNGVIEYYYDFADPASAEPISECEYHFWHIDFQSEDPHFQYPAGIQTIFRKAPGIANSDELELATETVCTGDNLKERRYLSRQGFITPQAPPTLKARCNPLPPTPISSSNSNTEKKKIYHNTFDGSIDISPQIILGIIFLFFIIISISGLVY